VKHSAYRRREQIVGAELRGLDAVTGPAHASMTAGDCRGDEEFGKTGYLWSPPDALYKHNG